MADANRINTRIAWLRKNRPNDPEIKQLQTRLDTLTPSAPPAGATPPASEAPPATSPPALGFDPKRVETRIAWLKKNRPNDPEIQKLQSKMQSAPAPSPDGTPAPVQGEPLQEVASDYAGDVAAGAGLGDVFDPKLDDRPSQGDLLAARDARQKELESYLARDIDSAYSKARENLEQEMFNRGIPAGSQQFTDRMRMLDDNFSRQRADIRAQALQFGGQEFERDFQAGETRRTNQLGEQVTVNQTNLGNVKGLTDIDLAYKTLAEQRRQANQSAALTRAQIARQGGSGGGSGPAQPVINSPFVG
jgi:hypothetical protein